MRTAALAHAPEPTCRAGRGGAQGRRRGVGSARHPAQRT
jgi:hypothetical protein